MDVLVDNKIYCYNFCSIPPLPVLSICKRWRYWQVCAPISYPATTNTARCDTDNIVEIINTINMLFVFMNSHFHVPEKFYIELIILLFLNNHLHHFHCPLLRFSPYHCVPDVTYGATRWRHPMTSSCPTAQCASLEKFHELRYLNHYYNVTTVQFLHYFYWSLVIKMVIKIWAATLSFKILPTDLRKFQLGISVARCLPWRVCGHVYLWCML